ncbi:lipopolysaccharide biosynthesis protein RfbH [Nitrogeniibacter mangrovi]|uniref:Lipopolysaccharide biosynthesis protein RfbH n=1 Tax=Nitrogeniibacter mangrovi TaxID=2016596 RepID=A0A6C1B550_9RHOO|nr:lipopolysaccharide biosynthesis protein RfbH [Nitrogeniibacter mangrovi]QID17334.1 lipopolysaccharide biosynthesis protein RfbH [Nitrogeniibacter mangrovi]
MSRDAVHGALSALFAETRTPPFVPGQTPIPPSGKVIGEAETRAMVDAALDGWLTTGRFNEQFEATLAAFVGVDRALTVNSGSSANLVAVSSLFSPLLGPAALTPGDEVITVAAGFPTTVNPVLQNGAVPVFVDILPGTYNIDPDLLLPALGPRTRAVVLAHTLGNPFDLAAVTAFCARHNLWLIEDCCDALGARYTLPADAPVWLPRAPSSDDPSLWRAGTDADRERHVGRFGHLATLSFYPAHHITMGEGGAVLLDDPLLARIAESIRDWGRDCWCAPGCDNTCGKRFGWQLGDLPAGYDHKYTYAHLGYNLKITDMQAACGLAQLGRLDGFVAARRAHFDHLSQRLADCAELLELPRATPHATPSWFGFPLTLRPGAGVNRVDLLQWLDQHKIGTRLLFAGNLTRQPYFAGRHYRVASELSETDTVMNHTFWIGLWPGLSEAMLDYAAEQICLFLGVGL